MLGTDNNINILRQCSSGAVLLFTIGHCMHERILPQRPAGVDTTRMFGGCATIRAPKRVVHL